MFLFLFGMSSLFQNAFSTNFTLNQSSGSLYYLEDNYCNDLNDIYTINTGSNVPVTINYNVAVETGCDFLYIYAIDYSNNPVLLAEIDGGSGSITTSYFTGKIVLAFYSDGSVCYADDGGVGDGFNVSFAAQSGYSAGQTYTYAGNTILPFGKVGIGTNMPNFKLDVNAATTGVGARVYNGSNYLNFGGLGSGTSYVKGYENIVAFGNAYTNGSTTLVTGNAERFRINPSGNVGIGTTAPDNLLDVRGVNSVTSGGHGLGAFANLAGTAGVINGWYANGSTVTGGWSRSINYLPYYLGTATTPQALTILDNGNVGIGTTTPWTGTKLDVRGNIFLDSGIDDTHIFWGGHNMTMGTPVDQWANNIFSLKPGGSTLGDLLTRFSMYHAFKKDSIIEKIRLSSAESSFFMGGNVGIGIKAPQYLLDVAGTIRAKEVIVTVNGFPDFVFEKNYNLLKLQDVDNYIQSNGHLPNIPSAKEVEKSGMNIADLQVKLLQKVEELTLYAIEQQKLVGEQQKRIEQLENALKDNK